MNSEMDQSNRKNFRNHIGIGNSDIDFKKVKVYYIKILRLSKK